MKPAIKTGVVLGTGAAINVECGFVPNVVQLYQGDSLLVTVAFLSWVVPFTSGGTVTILPGATIRGNTSRATATVKDVLVTAAGSFAAGTAAGFFVLEEGSLIGTFAAEDIVVTNLASGVLTTTAGYDATVTANVVYNAALAGTFSAPAAAAQISRYEGAAASASKGFTIGATLSVTAAQLRYVALREDV